MDWSSPRSTSRRVTRGRTVSSRAGMSQPHWASRQNTPTDLQGHRLAAGVGAADDQGAGVGGHLQIQGHDLVAARGAVAFAQGLHQQGMTAAADPQLPLRSLSGAGGPRTWRLHSRGARTVSSRIINSQASPRASAALFHRPVQLEEDAGFLGGDLQAGRGQFVGQAHHAAPVRRKAWRRWPNGRGRCPSTRRLSPDRRGRQKRSPRRVTSSPVVQPWARARLMAWPISWRTARSCPATARRRRASRGLAASRMRAVAIQGPADGAGSGR